MSVYGEWHDFVVVPRDPERIQTEHERLDISGAGRWDGRSDQLPDIHRVVWEDLSFSGNDVFEAMEITPSGGVHVWTRERVWTVFQKYGMEKLLFVPRHPPLPGSK
jgi:hypothetical protein